MIEGGDLVAAELLRAQEAQGRLPIPVGLHAHHLAIDLGLGGVPVQDQQIQGTHEALVGGSRRDQGLGAYPELRRADDPATWAKDGIMDLYGGRWHVGVDPRAIETHRGVDALTCQTPEMVREEIWAHLLAHDLVREEMAQAARGHGVTPRRPSFLGAVRTPEAFRSLPPAVTETDMPGLIGRVLAAIAAHRVGNRPNRYEPLDRRAASETSMSLPVPPSRSSRAALAIGKRRLVPRGRRAL